MDILKCRSYGAAIEAKSDVVEDTMDNAPSPLCHICEIEMNEDDETDFMIVVGDSQSHH